MATFKKTGFYLILCVILSSCEFKCSVGKDSNETDKPKTNATRTVTKDGTILTNGISLDARNIKVTKATLLYSDGSPVPDDNTIALNTKIKVNLFIEDGWKEKNKKVFIGASESISDDKGTMIVDADDLFKDYDETGIDPSGAKLLKLTAIIEEEGGGGSKYYDVKFRVWDKNGDGEIKGGYRFYIKH